MLGRIYQFIWFYSEWLVTPVNRRPWTFCMRDWLYNNVPMFIAILIAYFGLLFWLVSSHPLLISILIFFSAGLLAHLVWGTKWIEGQQEEGIYLGG